MANIMTNYYETLDTAQRKAVRDAGRQQFNNLISEYRNFKNESEKKQQDGGAAGSERKGIEEEKVMVDVQTRY